MQGHENRRQGQREMDSNQAGLLKVCSILKSLCDLKTPFNPIKSRTAHRILCDSSLNFFVVYSPLWCFKLFLFFDGTQKEILRWTFKPLFFIKQKHVVTRKPKGRFSHMMHIHSMTVGGASQLQWYTKQSFWHPLFTENKWIQAAHVWIDT